MKRFSLETAGLIVVSAVALLFASCDKDSYSAFSFPSAAVFVNALGATTNTEFTAENIASVEVSSVPEGWSVTCDLTTNTLKVTAPSVIDDKNVDSGSVTLVAYPYSGASITVSLALGIAKSVDLTVKQSNCFLVNTPNTVYTIGVTTKGESNEVIPTATVNIVWQTSMKLIKYLTVENGKASFYISADEDDDTKVVEGNALLAAYDNQGNIVWSWHIWVANYNESDVQTGENYTFMMRNLGGSGNTNATTDEILDSYGMYYQWGRKEPFVGPYYYNAASGTNHTMYNASNTAAKIVYEESTAETGTMDYAIANPLSYIYGSEDSKYDWLYTTHSTSLWGAEKSVYDPCPKGWKVAPKGAFAGFTIADAHTAADISKLKGAYGWNLKSGSQTSFYIGAGRRTQLDGKIQNVNTSDVPSPWIGCYWTSGVGTADVTSSAMYFNLDTDDVTASAVTPSVDYQRANGMQIRCVKQMQ